MTDDPGGPARLAAVTAPPGPECLADRVRATLAARLGVLDEAYRGLGDGTDPAAVHRARVASRRAREAVRIAALLLPGREGHGLAREGARVTRALGGLREEQVSGALLAKLGRRAPPEVAVAVDYLLLRSARRARRQATRTRRMSAERVLSFARRALAVLGTAPRGGAAEVAGLDLALPRVAAVEERARALLDSPTDATFHALRIAVKQLRYAVEILASEGRSEALTRSLKLLQDALGRHQDLAVVLARVEREHARLRRARRRHLAAAVAQVLHRVDERKRASAERVRVLLARWPAGAFERRARTALSRQD